MTILTVPALSSVKTRLDSCAASHTSESADTVTRQNSPRLRAEWLLTLPKAPWPTTLSNRKSEGPTFALAKLLGSPAISPDWFGGSSHGGKAECSGDEHDDFGDEDADTCRSYEISGIFAQLLNWTGETINPYAQHYPTKDHKHKSVTNAQIGCAYHR